VAVVAGKKNFLAFPEIKILKLCNLRNFQNLFFRTGKSIILLPLLPPAKIYILIIQCIAKHLKPIRVDRVE
jgi:hypothetical protein